MDWKQIIAGLIIGAIIGIASTFFLFQGRISRLEALINQLKNQERPSQSLNYSSKLAEKHDIETLFKKTKYTVEINLPQNNEGVEQNINMEGTFSGDLLSLHLWPIVHPKGSSGWWPQNSEIIPDPSNGNWEASVRLGNTGDVDKKFDIIIILATENAHESFNKYIQTGKETNNYPESPLPSGTRILAKVTVIRK